MGHHAQEGSDHVRIIIALVILLMGVAAVLGVATGAVSHLLPSHAGSTTETTAAATTSVARTLDDYSWEELATISSEIEASGGGDAAIAVARNYGLVDSSGALVSDAKSFKLSDGTEVAVQLAGICHDDKSDGSGKAGLTFVTVNAVARHSMNANGSNEGGWDASDMRSWLNADELATFPSDLSSRIVSVDKLTNNAGSTSSASDVTATSDKLWLLSATEVCGNIDWFAKEYGDQYAWWDDVANSEGTQYERYSQAGVGSYTDPSGVLAKSYKGSTTFWFYRTPYYFVYNFMDAIYYYGALDSGYPYGYEPPETDGGVVVGFCL